MPNPSAPRHNGKQQAPEVRKHNFEEVAEIFTKEEALAEAERCLNCKNPQCQANCPVGVQIPAFIALLKDGKVRGRQQNYGNQPLARYLRPRLPARKTL